jgi:hypothetical protein
MRRTADGRVYYLECNPRFYFKIAMSMLAGVNMVAAGLDDSHRRAPVLAARKTVRFPKAFLAAAARLRRPEAESWEALKVVLSDPAPYVLEALKWQE